MDAASISQLNRRKACDLCFVKKIKCDTVKPHCSNCKQYGAECKTTAVRRRAVQPKPKPKPATTEAGPASEHSRSSPESQKKISDLESRLARIEEQLQQVLNVASAALVSAKANNAKSNLTPMDPVLAAMASTDQPPLAGDTVTSWLQASNTSGNTASSPSTCFSSSPPSTESTATIIRPSQCSPKLPPIEAILPMVDHYFTQINPVIPLFSQSSFTRLLNEWYTSPPSRRTNAAWAAINIVLALSSRLPATPIRSVDFHSETTAAFATYLSNAQSVLSELVVRDQDLLGLQTLLGLVLLYQTLPDPRPGTVLIGAAVRLVHRLRMQSRDEIRILYPAEEGLHRTRLFWITYILDKEISMRHSTPSMQLDADIDQDLPSPDPADGVGDIWTSDGSVRVNYLRLRVRLAHIHGRIYDLLYSTRSTKISNVERQARVVRLSYLLENWRSSVPAEMQPAMMNTKMGRMGVVFMASMFCSYVTCMAMVHGVWSRNAEWIRKVSNYTRITLLDAGEEEGKSCGRQNPPLPSAWKRCVQIARECLGMMQAIPESDSNIWFNASGLFTSTVIVLSSMWENPGHDAIEEDQRMTQKMLGFLDKIKDLAAFMPLYKMHSILLELDRNTTMAIHAAREKRKALRDRLLGDPDGWSLLQGSSGWNQSVEMTSYEATSGDVISPGMAWDTTGAAGAVEMSLAMPLSSLQELLGQHGDEFPSSGQVFEFGDATL